MFLLVSAYIAVGIVAGIYVGLFVARDLADDFNDLNTEAYALIFIVFLTAVAAWPLIIVFLIFKKIFIWLVTELAKAESQE